MKAVGGVTGDYHGRQLVRHFRDPRAEYIESTEGVAVFDRCHRARFVVRGKAPRDMLNGVLTGSMPSPPTSEEGRGLAGRSTYSCVLTPKGRMITDLWCLGLGDEEGAGFLLDVPIAGAADLQHHLSKFLPPRLASVEDVTASTGMISVVGPRAAELLSRYAFGLRVGEGELSELAEGDWRAVGASVVDGPVVIRTEEVWPEAYNVVGPVGPVVSLWKAVVEADASPAGLGVWSTLRVEAGRPVFGTDMDQDTIPVEAGVHERGIDYEKGCYTGQEVIVRIRDRGHVNRHLRQLRLGDIPTPAKGTELFVEGQDKPVGVVTSAVMSPRYGETVALAYVRRGTEGDPRPR